MDNNKFAVRPSTAKRQNKMMVIVTISLIIAIPLAVIAFYQYKEAKEQKEFAIKLKDMALMIKISNEEIRSDPVNAW